MKKIVAIAALAFTALTIASCEEEIQFNDPSLQALNDYKQWRSLERSSEVINGNLIIKGNNGQDTLTILVSNYSFGRTYAFGEDTDVTARFVKVTETDTTVFITNNVVGSGNITFNAAERQVPGTVSGNFKIQLQDTLTNKTTDFHEGIIYRIPLGN